MQVVGKCDSEVRFNTTTGFAIYLHNVTIAQKLLVINSKPLPDNPRSTLVYIASGPAGVAGITTFGFNICHCIFWQSGITGFTAESEPGVANTCRVPEGLLGKVLLELVKLESLVHFFFCKT